MEVFNDPIHSPLKFRKLHILSWETLQRSSRKNVCLQRQGVGKVCGTAVVERAGGNDFEKTLQEWTGSCIRRGCAVARTFPASSMKKPNDDINTQKQGEGAYVDVHLPPESTHFIQQQPNTKAQGKRNLRQRGGGAAQESQRGLPIVPAAQNYSSVQLNGLHATMTSIGTSKRSHAPAVVCRPFADAMDIIPPESRTA